MKKTVFILLFAVVLFLALAACSAQTKPTAEIVILHTNDIHGRVASNDYDIIGIDRIAAIHKNTPNGVLVDAGDALHGLPVATLSRGEDIAALMKAAGYAAMAIGNHEFNYGTARLKELRDIAGFPFLTSNVTADGEKFLDDTTIINIDGVKVGIFGIVTEATAGLAMPGLVSGLVFNDPIQTAREKTDYLQGQGVHLIVALCHLGSEPYSGTLSTQLAAAVPEIDIIIDGHSHTELSDGLVANGVLIAQTGGHGQNLGKIVISIENGEVVTKTASLITFEDVQDVAPDEEVAQMLIDISNTISAILEEPIGESLVSMSSDRSPGVRTQEMPIGNLVADAYRAAADADIAIANGGDIRADVITGIITKGDIISILPFGNTLMVKNITPAVLFEVLENGVSGIVAVDEHTIDYELSPQGRFPQISGFNFVYDPTAPIGERIISVALDNGTLLSAGDNTTVLTLAGSNYVMTGGDYYSMLETLPVHRELSSADEALSEYIRKNSPINTSVTGRITLLAQLIDNIAA
ncbi:MAG: 5'-nucleotidase C-terminal domain-containing protein [Oscillospiraceae bacterium]|nr:5'-nucleotidase C-terminal domain-containing protein [Oscillospiraceae bacterium]